MDFQIDLKCKIIGIKKNFTRKYEIYIENIDIYKIVSKYIEIGADFIYFLFVGK